MHNDTSKEAIQVWYWGGGFWWPGFVLMAVLMVVCMLLMARMMGSNGGWGMCGFWRWFRPRDDADGAGRTPAERR